MNDDEKYSQQLESEQKGTMQLTTPEPLATVKEETLPVKNIEVTAENADEMALCQSALIKWCYAKVAEVRQQQAELQAAYEHAVKMKWRSDTLKRHAAIAGKRSDFYDRIRIALEHGYQIVPSFPITAFAVRTDRKRPLKLSTTQWRASHEQKAESLPAGEGEYKNPFPPIYERVIRQRTATESEVKEYFCQQEWTDLEFPVSMSKPKIMEAATRAMALQIFDDLGILPGYAPHDGTKPPKGDPMIIARIFDPRPLPRWQTRRFVSFIVGWHLNTKDL